MGKLVVLFTFLLASNFLVEQAYASTAAVEAFANSEESILKLDLTHLREVASHIAIAGPSLLERWGVINSQAAASYNSKLKTIIFKDDILTHENGTLSLMSAPELKVALGAGYQATVSMIFHEFAHAEYDVLIENDVNESAASIHRMFENEIKPWFRAAHPELNFYTAPLAAWELYGYYRQEIIDELNSDMLDILTDNGLNYFTSKCYLSPYLKQQATKLSLEDFEKLMPVNDSYNTPYRDTVAIDDVFVFGNDVDLTKSAIEPFHKQWFQAMWDQFAADFHAPKNKAEFTALLGKDARYLKLISDCRDPYWHQVNNR